MGSRTRILIFCLLYVVRASEVLAEEVEFRAKFPRDIKDPASRLDASIQETDGTDRQSEYKLRDKRALGLLLSGLAQIFGYTVTPIQIASLQNPTNVAGPTATSITSGNVVGQQVASTQPTSVTPKQQETLRFTGVVNFGNNSDIVGHLQRYEQIFHGRQNNATNMLTTNPRPASMPIPPATISATKPPLLAPFFVKIPLPIAPNLPPATIPIEDFKLSYPAPAVSTVNESKEKPAETPVRTEQETTYRNNKNTEQYTVEKKNIYNEKDVMKPVNHYTHQLNVKPSLQQDDKQQHKQEERVERLKDEQKNCDKNTHKEDERGRSREEESADRNREDVSKYESAEEREPAHEDDEENEDSAERYEEHTRQANKSSKQPPREDEREETEDDESDEQFRGYKQLENYDKYIQVGYNHQQLPIGDYFHEGDVIRDSYGEILDDKKLEDDRIGYISMFKHPPYVYDSRERIRDPEEDEREPPNNGYDEHLIRLQKLREEYALPKNKYEEYDLNDEGEAKRDDRDNERIQNRTSTRPKAGVRGKEDNRGKIPIGLNKNHLRDDTKSQEELSFARHIPLIVPIRYVDTNDKVQQATTQQLRTYKESGKLPINSRFSQNNVVSTLRTPVKENLTPQIGLPERPRKLHEESEDKNLQVWPPPFDYVFDNTAPANTIISPNSLNYPLNYYQHVKNIAANDAKSESSSEQPSGYLVVVGNPAHPYRYPYNVYYFPKENLNPQNQEANTQETYPRNQIYVPRQSINQQLIRANQNLTEYNLDETATRAHYHQPYEASSNLLDRYRYILAPEVRENLNPQNQEANTQETYPRNQIYVPQQSINQQLIRANQNPTEYYLNENATKAHYHQPHEAPTNLLDRYRYILAPEVKEQSVNIDISQIPNINNWSNRIYQSQGEQSPLVQLQNVASSNQNVQSRPLNSRYSQPVERQDSRLRSGQPGLISQVEDQRKADEKVKILRPISTGKPFDDPQSAHDFFGFSRDDYGFAGESSEALKVAEENGKIAKESDVPLEPVVYHYDNESAVKHADEPENDTEKAKVTEYRNKVATLKISEQRQLKPNGPIHYVEFIRNI